MKKYLYFAALTIVFSCSKELSSKEKSVSTIMNLEHMEVGQKFYFTLLVGDSYNNGTGQEFRYTGDTLELEVLSKISDYVIIAEEITNGSQMRSAIVDYYWLNNETRHVNYWYLRNDSLIVEPLTNPEFLTTDLLSYTGPPLDGDEPHAPINPNDAPRNYFFKSHLLFNYKLSLTPFNQEETWGNGWKTTNNYIERNKDLYIKNYDLKGKRYAHLNVSIKNSPMSFDGYGNTTFYSKENGIVRTSVYTWWGQYGFGWDKL